MPTPIPIFGRLIDIRAIGLPHATATFELMPNRSKHYRVPGTAAIAGPRVTFEAGSDGRFSGTLWSTDVTQPAGMVYVMTVTDQAGKAQKDCAFTLTGSGPVDLSLVTCS